MNVLRTKRELIESVIRPTDRVLDIGFAGQALQPDSKEYPHTIIRSLAKETYGVDLILPAEFSGSHYQQANAESFSFDDRFDVVIALDVIEHISNLGLFLDRCKEHLVPGGRLILTTPNAFNMFSLVEKITHDEPNVNKDHTLYLNKPTITVLLRKNGWKIDSFLYLTDMLGTVWVGGIKRKLLAALYTILLRFTPKFSTTMVIIATPSQ